MRTVLVQLYRSDSETAEGAHFQHKGRSFQTNNLLTCPENSKIVEHSLNSGHSIHDHNFKILDNPHNFDRRILESLWIHNLKPSLNDRSCSVELSIV